MGVATTRMGYALRVPMFELFSKTKTVLRSKISCAMRTNVLAMIDTAFERPLYVSSYPISTGCVVKLGCMCMGTEMSSLSFAHPLFRILSHLSP